MCGWWFLQQIEDIHLPNYYRYGFVTSFSPIIRSFIFYLNNSLVKLRWLWSWSASLLFFFGRLVSLVAGYDNSNFRAIQNFSVVNQPISFHFPNECSSSINFMLTAHFERSHKLRWTSIRKATKMGQLRPIHPSNPAQLVTTPSHWLRILF